MKSGADMVEHREQMVNIALHCDQHRDNATELIPTLPASFKIHILTVSSQSSWGMSWEIQGDNGKPRNSGDIIRHCCQFPPHQWKTGKGRFKKNKNKEKSKNAQSSPIALALSESNSQPLGSRVVSPLLGPSPAYPGAARAIP